jgi:hypothetical protein
MTNTTQEDKPKKRGQQDPEFMAKMRQKAAEKRAEQKMIKDAQKLKEQQQYEHQLKEAQEILNNKKPKASPTKQEQPIESESDDDDATPTQKTPKTPKQKPATPASNYKQEYYRHKLEMLKANNTKPPQEEHMMRTKPQQPLPHQLLRSQFEKDINSTVMQELYKRYFKTQATPYD